MEWIGSAEENVNGERCSWGWFQNFHCIWDSNVFFGQRFSGSLGLRMTKPRWLDFQNSFPVLFLLSNLSHGCLLAVEPNWVSYCVPSQIAMSVPLGAVTFLLLEINSPKESKPFVSVNFSSFSLESSALTITLSKVCHPCIH